MNAAPRASTFSSSIFIQVGIIPLNITADDKNERLIRNSIGKFIVQRLNNGGLTAERALTDIVKTPEVLDLVLMWIKPLKFFG